MASSAHSSTDNLAPEATLSSHVVPDSSEEGVIDFRDLFTRTIRGLPQALGLAALGLVIAAVIWLMASPFRTMTTSTRVTFSFSGYAKGEYPDHSKFQPDDLRAPDIVAEALKRQGLDASNDLQSKVRAALTIEGIIPPDVIKERDRIRVAGQPPTPYIPDEFLVTLNLPRRFPLTSRQRELLLTNIVTAYQENFQHTYAQMPLALGNAFATLSTADYPEYELVLTQEMQKITDFLKQQLSEKASDTTQAEPATNAARTFRSRTTNLSFSDLMEQTRLFAQIQLNETLGLIYQNGLSRNRSTAMVKMDYYLRTLQDEEQHAVQDEKVVDDLLAKAQEHAQSYVLGIKSEVARQNIGAPIIDQGLVDSLLVNDAYNFLVRRALDAGLAVKLIQAEESRLLDRRKNMEAFQKNPTDTQSAVTAQVQESLGNLQKTYDSLISEIRETYLDYARQQFADAVRISMQPISASNYKPLAIAGIIGLCLGMAAGTGLSLLGVYMGKKK